MKRTIAILSALIGTIGLIYLLGVGYYSDKFVAQSEYLAVNISQLTPEKAEQQIEQEIDEREVTLKENGKAIKTFKIKEANPVYQLTDSLKALYYQQDPAVWFMAFIDEYASAEEEPEAEIILDLTELVEELNSQDGRVASQSAEIKFSEKDGYYVEPSETGTVIGEKELNQAIVDELDKGDVTVELEDTYEPATVLSTDEEVTELMEYIEQISDRQITLDLYDQEIIIDSNDIQGWLLFDESNQATYDRDAIRAYLSELNDEYGTYNKVRDFNSTMQGRVQVQPGIMGWGIDVEAETEALIDALGQSGDLRREPVISSLGGIPGAVDDSGDSYIEIDLSYQMMFLYVDGELIIQTDIVSGKIGAETQPGANAVIEMLQDTNLVGFNPFYEVDYSTPVDYWMRFDYDDQGIHDASWQGWFGGDIWTHSGSLGCINTPIDTMEVIYNNSYYGMPVIVFH